MATRRSRPMLRPSAHDRRSATRSQDRRRTGFRCQAHHLQRRARSSRRKPDARPRTDQQRSRADHSCMLRLNAKDGEAVAGHIRQCMSSRETVAAAGRRCGPFAFSAPPSRCECAFIKPNRVAHPTRRRGWAARPSVLLRPARFFAAAQTRSAVCAVPAASSSVP